MKNTKNPYFHMGASMAAQALGVDRDGLIRLEAQREVMRGPDSAPFHRELCKIASAAFESEGDYTSAPAILYRNLSQEKEWHPQYQQFTDPVLKSLSKSAAMLLPGVAALHDKAGGGILKTLTAGGALGGAALGSIAFLLSRNAQQSSAESAQLLEKVKTYKKLKRDIEEDIAANGALA